MCSPELHQGGGGRGLAEWHAAIEQRRTTSLFFTNELHDGVCFAAAIGVCREARRLTAMLLEGVVAGTCSRYTAQQQAHGSCGAESVRVERRQIHCLATQGVENDLSGLSGHDEERAGAFRS